MYQVFELVNGKYTSVVVEDGFPTFQMAKDFIEDMKDTFRHKNSKLFIFKMVEE